MSTFTTPLAIVPLMPSPIPLAGLPMAGCLPLTEEELDVAYIDGRNWRVLEEFDFASKVLERIVRIPAGFTTDFVSSPRITWPIFPPTGKYGKASVGHDYGYRTPGFCTKDQADQLFVEMMEALRVPWLTRRTMYLAVHLLGGPNYKGGL